MVDALRRAHRLLTPGGTLIDLHPSPAAAVVEVGGAAIGCVDALDAPQRHAAADTAIAAAMAERLFRVAAATEFDFFTYGDSIEELRDYVAEEWVSARIADDLVEQARRALRSAPVAAVRLRERVKAARCEPLTRMR
jgi:hypothetical protein